MATHEPREGVMQPGLAVFDMDSTLIQQEVIDELADAIGQRHEVARITELAMQGVPPYNDFAGSLRARVKLLEGVHESIWEHLKTNVIKFTPGASELIKVLRSLGWKTAVLSGGFTPLAEWVKDTLGLDHAYANHLAVDPSTRKFTGELEPGHYIVDGARKEQLLIEIAKEHNIALERTIAVGDGSNDLLMMHRAGIGLAYNAKPSVQNAAPMKLNSQNMLDIMQVLGYSKEEVDHLASGHPNGDATSENHSN